MGLKDLARRTAKNVMMNEDEHAVQATLILAGADNESILVIPKFGSSDEIASITGTDLEKEVMVFVFNTDVDVDNGATALTENHKIQFDDTGVTYAVDAIQAQSSLGWLAKLVRFDPTERHHRNHYG